MFEFPILSGLDEIQRLLYAKPPEDVVRFAFKHALTRFADFTADEREELVEIANCRFCCELYLEARAAALGKHVIYVENGKPISPVPNESLEGETDWVVANPWSRLNPLVADSDGARRLWHGEVEPSA